MTQEIDTYPQIIKEIQLPPDLKVKVYLVFIHYENDVDSIWTSYELAEKRLKAINGSGYFEKCFISEFELNKGTWS